MDENERLELTKRYEEISDEALMEFLSEGKEQFTEEAYKILLAEAEKRKSSNKDFGKLITIRDELQAKNEITAKGLGWFNIQPYDIKMGGGYLIFFGAVTMIFNFFYLPSVISIINIIVGFILLGLGVGALKGKIPCLYLGVFLWLIGFVITTLQVVESMGTEHEISPIRILFQFWVSWELIKSTPKYRYFFEKHRKKKVNE